MDLLMIGVMNEFVSEVVFGKAAKKLKSGVSVSDGIQRVSYLLHTAAAQHPLNMASAGLAGRLGLIQSVRDARAQYSEIINCIYSDFRTRLTLPESQLGMNLIDISIRHNRGSPEDKQLSIDEITQFCLDMRSSAQDTIMNTVSFIL